MGWTKYQVLVAVVLVITGSINTLSTKWADRMKAKGSDGEERHFNHPFIQACAMFIGEMLCLLSFKLLYFHFWRKHDGSHNEMILLKGNRAVIVFVGIFSIIFLRQRLTLQEWGGIFLVIVGLALVGVSDFLAPTTQGAHGSNKTTTEIIIGTIISIAFFNFAGISVTKEISATTRMVLDSVRTLFIYSVSLALGWQKFFWLQIIGFVLLVAGMALYNDLFTMLIQRIRGRTDEDSENRERILSHQADEIERSIHT
ncbi:hypothetical protein C0J52_12348 [Blattella germanica]|nr:hypothetical protein C0J52_12348 [Blattella germanica]